jgi:hypothetical protein
VSISMKLQSALLIMMAGCGSVGAPGDGEPYTTFNGSISSVLSDVRSPVRAAVLWEVQGSSAVRVSQEIAVAGSFPAAFTLPLTALPPLEAMQQPDPSKSAGLDPSMRFAVGTLIVYEDLNRNGRLDLASLEQPAIDRILGTLPDEFFFYIEGTPPPSGTFNGLALSRGFNLVALPQWAPDPQRACEPGCPERKTRDWSLVSNAAPLEINLTGSPALASFVCQRDPSQGGMGSATPTVPPTGAQVTCSADGTAYEYQACQVPTTPCDTQSCIYGWGTRDPGTIPTGWPCR